MFHILLQNFNSTFCLKIPEFDGNFRFYRKIYSFTILTGKTNLKLTLVPSINSAGSI